MPSPVVTGEPERALRAFMEELETALGELREAVGSLRDRAEALDRRRRERRAAIGEVIGETAARLDEAARER